MSTVFTFPGKAGDALLQFPVAYQWHKKTGAKFTCWMDEQTTKMVAPLFAAQPCVEAVEFKPGITNWNCGGQPWHFDLPTSAFEGHTVYHLGFRGFPERQITLQTLENAKLPVTIDRERLASDTCFFVPALPNEIGKRRLVLHGNPICQHTRATPNFWKFLASISAELESLFDEIVWVGNERDREIGMRTYPWKEFDDGGSFLETARLMAGSSCVIGCGSSMVALAGTLKIPCIRVHDPLGDSPRVIWDNLGENQLNRSALELRSLWPGWRDKWVVARVPV